MHSILVFHQNGLLGLANYTKYTPLAPLAPLSAPVRERGDGGVWVWGGGGEPHWLGEYQQYEEANAELEEEEELEEEAE